MQTKAETQKKYRDGIKHQLKELTLVMRDLVKVQSAIYTHIKNHDNKMEEIYNEEKQIQSL